MSPNCQPLSVVIGIVTRNRAILVRKAIDSALNQNIADRSVWVVNDGSTDDTSQIAAEYPNVTWIDWSVSRGCIAAREYLIGCVSADYFVGLDDDAWFLAGDEIAVACRAMDTDARIGAIAFDILSSDRSEVMPRSGLERVSSFIGCGHMLRLSAVREVGGYEEVPGTYGVEEKDLCLRMMDASYDVVRLNGVHVWHDKTPVAREVNAQHRSGVCNDFVMTVRRTPLLLLPPALLSKSYRHISFALRRRLLGPALAGFAMFLKTLPTVWRTRNPVKAATLRAFMRLRTR